MDESFGVMMKASRWRCPDRWAGFVPSR